VTAKQSSLYWREWAAARRAAIAAGHTIDRHECHTRALGKPKSSKLLTNADLDKVLAIFRSYTRPADLRPQLRQLRMPRIRLEHKIVIEQAALLAVLLPPHATIQPCNHSTALDRQLAAESYILQIMRERFGTTDIKAIPHDLDNTDPTRKDTPLEMLRNTLSSRINKLRNAAGLTIHEMNQLAGLACDCKPCCLSRNLPTTAPELTPEPDYADA
jgi:hypothetical protein